MGQQVHTLAVLLFPVGLTTMSTDYLDWTSFFSPVVTCQKRILLPGRPWKDGVGRFPVQIFAMLVSFTVV